MIKLELDAEDYSLQRSLEPSFISSLYERRHPTAWTKIAGKLGGRLKIEQHGSKIVASCSVKLNENELRRIVLLETGLWHENPMKELVKVSRGFREILEELAITYPGVRIPIAPHDSEYVFLAVLLSKRADYDIVRRWCRKIWEIYDGDLTRMAEASERELERITRSYQLFEAAGILREILQRSSNIERWLIDALSRPPEIARITLLSIRGIGPKLADSIILSTCDALHFAPCDIHLAKFIERTGLIQEFHLPVKSLCIRYSCSEDASRRYGIPLCPRSETCLRAIISSRLARLAGWFQTLVYLHGRKFCKTLNPACDICPLRRSCRR